MDAVVRVKCLGGRELQGTLRGFDDLVNLVLDDSVEYLRGECQRSSIMGGMRRNLRSLSWYCDRSLFRSSLAMVVAEVC